MRLNFCIHTGWSAGAMPPAPFWYRLITLYKRAKTVFFHYFFATMCQDLWQKKVEVGNVPCFMSAESSSPPPPPSLRPIIPGGNRNGGVDLLGNASDCSTMPWYDNSSLRPQLLPSSRRLPASSQKIVSPAADNEVGGCMGPIYEDIDRMCSYRGYPPDSYYNLSGGSSPRNKSSNR